MSRNKGLASFSANFEPQIAAPLDARFTVTDKADLVLTSIWEANDGGVYIYKGIVVAVTDDIVPNNNGLYLLKEDDYTLTASWEKLSMADSAGELIENWVASTAYTAGTKVIDPASAFLYRVTGDYTSSTDIQVDIGNGNLELIAEQLYTNATAMQIEVGGIDIGTTFENKTMVELWDMLLYPELFPNLTNPSQNFSSDHTGLKEIGESLNINFSASFDRGNIDPAYTTSGNRSGLPNQYAYTGDSLPATVASTLLTDAQSITSYAVVAGSQSWTVAVSHDIGEQPLSNKGNNYDSPLPAGTLTASSVSITGVYPYFATTSSITTNTQQSLISHSASYFYCDMVAESGTDKQTAQFPQDFDAITGIQFYNTVSGSWEWVGGSAANSLTTFDTTTTTKTIQGNSVNYDVYTHNGALVGARELRFYT